MYFRSGTKVEIINYSMVEAVYRMLNIAISVTQLPID